MTDPIKSKSVKSIHVQLGDDLMLFYLLTLKIADESLKPPESVDSLQRVIYFTKE